MRRRPLAQSVRRRSLEISAGAMSPTIPPIIDFLECHLGEMAGGLIVDSPRHQGVQVPRFESQPVQGAVSYVTTGLCKHVLRRSDGDLVRLELLGCVWDRFRGAGFDSVLALIARDILEHHHAPRRGDVVRPRGPVVEGSCLEGVFWSDPGYHPEALEVLRFDGGEVRLLWAIPVSVSEVEFIEANGWRTFDELLRSRNPDLMDLHRDPVA